MVMRYDPLQELDRLADRLTGTARQPRAFPMDAYRRRDDFFIHFDLPGVDPDDIELTTERNVLTVRAERVYERQEGDEIVVLERPEGTFSRQVLLGEGLDTDAVEATYEQGVLTLRIPVAEAAKPKRVNVQRSGGGRQTIEGSASRGEGG